MRARRRSSRNPLAISANWRRGSSHRRNTPRRPGRRGASRGTWGGRTCARAQTPRNSYARCLSPSRDQRRDRVAGRRRARVRISTATTEAASGAPLDAAVNPPNPGGVTAATAPAPAGRSTEAGVTPAVRAAVRGTGGPGTSSSARRIEPRRRGRSRFVEVSQIHRPTSRRRPRRRTPSPPTDRATAKYRFASRTRTRTRTRIRSPVVRLARRPPPPRRLGTWSSPTPPNAPPRRRRR